MIFGLFSCNQEEPTVKGNILERFLADPLSTEYLSSIDDIWKSELIIRNGNDANTARLLELQDEADLKNYLRNQYENSDELYELIMEFGSLAMQVREKYPELVLLDENEKANFLKEYFSKSSEKKNGENARVMEICTEQLESSLDACRQGATVSAVGCGVLSPTIFAAAVCGVSTLAGLEICNDAAWDSFSICIKSN